MAADKKQQRGVFAGVALREREKKRPGGAGALAPAGRRAARDFKTGHIFSGTVIFSMVRPPAMVFLAATQRASRACCSASGSPLTRQAV